MPVRRILISVLILVPAVLGSAELTVMSWNLADMDLFDGDGEGRVSWQAEAEKGIAGVIRMVSPDILFIAEAPSLAELNAFAGSHLPGYSVHHVRQQSGNRDFADGMAMLSRIPLSGVTLVTPPVPRGRTDPRTIYLDWSYRGLMVATGEDLTIIGVHLKSPWDGKRGSYEIRQNQMTALAGFVSGLDGPVLVMGDFNDSPGLDGTERAFGIPDALSILDGLLIRSPGGENTQEDGLNIDHIFLRGGTPGDRIVVESPWTLSDHRPVYTVIKIPD